MEDKLRKIHAFWEKQAEIHQNDLAATNPDPLAKELELNALREVLDPNMDTLEAGCGNGFNLFALADTFKGKLVGFDYSEKMISAANERCKQLSSANKPVFHVESILNKLRNFGVYRQIFTDRCLINLSTIDEQIAALENLIEICADDGIIALVEPTQQGQERLNEMRKIVGLKPIEYHWHNLYLDEDVFLSRVPESLAHIHTENFSSLYFVISRVFNAMLTPTGKDPDYLSEINQIAAKLPSIGDNGPLKLFLFRKSSS